MPNDTAHVDWDRMTVAFDDGTSGRIVEFMDDDGEETDDPDYAAALIVEDHAGQRSMVQIGEYQSVH